MRRFLILLSAVLSTFFACSKSDIDPKLYDYDFTITSNFVLGDYRVVSRDNPNSVLLTVEKPERESSVTRTDNGVNYTFSSYKGKLSVPDKKGRYTFVLPSTTNYRIVKLVIGGKTFDFRGGVPIHFEVGQ